MSRLLKDAQDTLEQLVDSHTLTDVVIALAIIAKEKAVHIEGNWQDEITAKTWQKDTNKLTKVWPALIN